LLHLLICTVYNWSLLNCALNLSPFSVSRIYRTHCKPMFSWIRSCILDTKPMLSSCLSYPGPVLTQCSLEQFYLILFCQKFAHQCHVLCCSPPLSSSVFRPSSIFFLVVGSIQSTYYLDCFFLKFLKGDFDSLKLWLPCWYHNSRWGRTYCLALKLYAGVPIMIAKVMPDLSSVSSLFLLLCYIAPLALTGQSHEIFRVFLWQSIDQDQERSRK
jgi:hypothetical protein